MFTSNTKVSQKKERGFWETSEGNQNKSIPPGICLWQFLNVLPSMYSKRRLKTPTCLGQNVFGLHQKVKIPVERRHFSRKCTFNQNSSFPAEPVLTTAVPKLRGTAVQYHLLLPGDCPGPLDLTQGSHMVGRTKVKSFAHLTHQVIRKSIACVWGKKLK